MPQKMEPVRTIYTEEWVRACSEVEKLRGRQPFSRALAQLEAAWEDVRPLEWWCERTPALYESEAESALRYHIEVEVVDLFRWIASGTLQFIPYENGRSIDDLETEVEGFGRNVRLLLMAVQARSVPRAMRKMARRYGNPLILWSRTFGETITAVRRHLDETGE